jgi:starvation-inducible DNA-binding protein
MKHRPTLISSRKINHHLSTPSNFSEKAKKSLARCINELVADAFALFIKTKNFHWHVSGKHYRDYHLLLDEQSEQIFAMIDVLAERVRKIGESTIRSLDDIKRLTEIENDNDEFVPPTEMIRRLMHDNKNFAERIRHAHEICDEHKDIATASILEAYLDETERRVWFLFETQENVNG